MATHANNLRHYRKAANLTQAALVEAIGGNQQLIQRYETGPHRAYVYFMCFTQSN
jgi:transcriptional regulator with XRE-family HTH domain